jgi:surface protein
MSLSTFITERLKITSNSKSAIHKPSSRDELKSIIEQELERQGPDADLNHIDVSYITDMSYLFYKLNIENIKIDQWDVSNVTNMEGMFYECSNFEGNGLENWDVSNVTTMEDMFSWCKKLNVDLSSWNVTNVKNMSYMFYFCERFNCDLSEWDVSKVIKYYMTFDKCPNMGTNPQLQPKFKQ